MDPIMLTAGMLLPLGYRVDVVEAGPPTMLALTYCGVELARSTDGLVAHDRLASFAAGHHRAATGGS